MHGQVRLNHIKNKNKFQSERVPRGNDLDSALALNLTKKLCQVLLMNFTHRYPLIKINNSLEKKIQKKVRSDYLFIF